ncbi:ferredoxin [Nocardioides immobilis]|uniref:Ferredoxin n=1 Tax=Nocardioides immobilis TaxID=2049295 RepID=A0A417Y7Z5_9ACTN|nr:ferredoxin [Nocardioides immobilis]RHW28586.1 ferredoxin [Nocardioides immobilis]
MRVHIELDQCEGHGQCATADAGLFLLNGDGYAARADIDIPAGADQAAAAGVAACPMSAISLLGA